MAGAAVILLLITVDVLAGGLLTYLDDAVRDATIPTIPTASPGWTHVVGVLGSPVVAPAVVIVVAVVTMQLNWLWWPGVLAVGELVATGLLVLVLKHLVGRSGPRPDSLTDGYPGFFPSGHTATAAVCVATITFLVSSSWGTGLGRARRYGLVSGAVAGVVVGASTVLGGFHWLTDALASMMIAAAVLVCGFAMAQAHVDGLPHQSGARRG
jgi:undecaprenyl-diphosphatase